ncbi:myelin-associated glycoprotein-like isoform X2 [Varroa jacobsoni]|uniref:myelin-associated glycoprotein-like isoform X2 n=1 Tax=Varroa jacobsoni TaxID=62625 RepID=UPI000BF3359A|nr:myelin-associated glycoprotein-like isoform X2 [Varroa jacobsoni]
MYFQSNACYIMYNIFTQKKFIKCKIVSKCTARRSHMYQIQHGSFHRVSTKTGMASIHWIEPTNMSSLLFGTFCIFYSSFTLVHSQAAPEIIRQQIPNDLAEGQRLSVMCSVRSGTPPISFTWRKDGNSVAALPGVKISHIDDFQDLLHIESLSVDHVGNYTCNAKNLYGSGQMFIHVGMNFAPKWIASVPGNEQTGLVTAVAGEAVRVDCRASGHPPPIIRLLKGNQVLSEKRYRLDSSVLTIPKVEVTDKGEYTCFAENAMGKIQRKVTIMLNGKVYA